MRRSLDARQRSHSFSSTTAAFRCSPASFARFIGDFRNAALNCSWFNARMSVASVAASFPAMNSRARNGESSATSSENITFHGQQVWEMCRYNRFQISLVTGSRTFVRHVHYASGGTCDTSG
jgi:hypothetical protein